MFICITVAANNDTLRKKKRAETALLGSHFQKMESHFPKNAVNSSIPSNFRLEPKQGFKEG